MRVVCMLCAYICMLLCNSLYAATYEKASDNQIKVIETVESSEILNVPQIEHEIAGIDADILRIEESYAKQRGEFETRKARYEAMLMKCVELEIAEPVVIELPPEVIEEPVEPDNG